MPTEANVPSSLSFFFSHVLDSKVTVGEVVLVCDLSNGFGLPVFEVQPKGWDMVNSYSETWLHQSSVVTQHSQPLRVVAGRIGRRLVFESDHIAGLGSTNSATCASWVDGVFKSVVLMWVFAAGVGR